MMDIKNIIIRNDHIIHFAKIQEKYYQLIFNDGYILLTKKNFNLDSKFVEQGNYYFTPIDKDIIEDIIDYKFVAKYLDSEYEVLGIRDGIVTLSSNASNATAVKKDVGYGFIYNRDMSTYIKNVSLNEVDFQYVDLGSQIEKYNFNNKIL